MTLAENAANSAFDVLESVEALDGAGLNLDPPVRAPGSVRR
jgi:hypothetical protein